MSYLHTQPLILVGVWEYGYDDPNYPGYPERHPLARPPNFTTADTSQQSSSFPQRTQSVYQPLSDVSRHYFNFSAGRTETIQPQVPDSGAPSYSSETLHESDYMLSPRFSQDVFALTPRTEHDPEPSSLFSRKSVPPKSGYKYIPLDKEDKYRLLLLEPGQGDQKIECSLVNSTHFDQEYEALSYVWGDSLPNCEIIITRPKARTGGRGAKSLREKFYIRPNLYEALRYLRHRVEPRHLWIDAICIDQENPKEKSQQVCMMAEIYNRAKNVLVWLGAPNSSFDTAIKFLKGLSHMDLVLLNRVTHDVQYLKKWHALAKVMKNQYFHRLWVIQEVGFARSATVLSGDAAVDWTIFAEGVVLFGDYFEEIKQLSYRSTDPDAANIIATTGWIHVSGAYNLIVTLNRVFYRSIDGVIFRRAWKLNDLVLRLTQFGCSDPRDTIYAVLSLAEENDAVTSLAAPREGAQLLKPDYEKSVAEVLIEFVEFYVSSTQSLDIICRQWAVGARPRAQGAKTNPFKECAYATLPSWILLRSEPVYHIDGNCNQSVSGNSLVGDDPAHTIYNAASGSKPEVQFGRRIVEGRQRLNGIMTAKGVRLATIGSLGDRVLQGIISAETLRMGGWDGVEYGQDLTSLVPAKLWRTMVADRSAEGLAAPSWYQKACISTLLYSGSSGDIDTQKLIMDKNMPPTIVKFLKRVQSVVWNRKFLLSKTPSEGLSLLEELFGIAPKCAQEGDLICILFGCSVPVILRERTKESESFFEFVGDAYIHGMMEGEAFVGKNADEVERWSERFELR
jgi:hypothetical protein